MEYLQTTRMSVDDVAWKVGFSDSANLRRAIRRWTGGVRSAPFDRDSLSMSSQSRGLKPRPTANAGSKISRCVPPEAKMIERQVAGTISARLNDRYWGAKPPIGIRDSNFFTANNRRNYDIDVSRFCAIALAAVTA